VEIEGIKIKNEKTYQIIKQILKRKEGRATQKTVLLLRLFAEGAIDAKELEILNHFDVLDVHKRNKHDKSYQESWKENGKVFTGIKELHIKHDEQQKFFDNVLQLVEITKATDATD
jgi:hypothetical protein